jgi:hypothetical protein
MERNMHRTLSLPPPWTHHSSVDVTGFVPPHDGRPDEVKGRAILTLGTSGFELSLRPTAAELRALATLCQQLADDTDTANVPPFGASRAVWPAGCTHLPGVPS